MILQLRLHFITAFVLQHSQWALMTDVSIPNTSNEPILPSTSEPSPLNGGNSGNTELFIRNSEPHVIRTDLKFDEFFSCESQLDFSSYLQTKLSEIGDIYSFEVLAPYLPLFIYHSTIESNQFRTNYYNFCNFIYLNLNSLNLLTFCKYICMNICFLKHIHHLWSIINIFAEEILIESDLSQILRLASSLGLSFSLSPDAQAFSSNSELHTDSLAISIQLSLFARTLRSIRRSILLLQEIETLSSGYLLYSHKFLQCNFQ